MKRLGGRNDTYSLERLGRHVTSLLDAVSVGLVGLVASGVVLSLWNKKKQNKEEKERKSKKRKETVTTTSSIKLYEKIKKQYEGKEGGEIRNGETIQYETQPVAHSHWNNFLIDRTLIVFKTRDLQSTKGLFSIVFNVFSTILSQPR